MTKADFYKLIVDFGNLPYQRKLDYEATLTPQASRVFTDYRRLPVHARTQVRLWLLDGNMSPNASSQAKEFKKKFEGVLDDSIPVPE